MHHLKTSCLLLLLFCLSPAAATENNRFVYTPYKPQKVVFDFYFDEPAKINSALYWIRSYLNPLLEEPYSYVPEEMEIIVIIHGTEIVTTVKKNRHKYKDTVARMKYYADFGVKYKVCGLVMDEYGYKPADFLDFVEVVPSAITELAHWQSLGYAVIRPTILQKKSAIEDIR
ncbi:MAG: DsrE family protein [Gammaproteobacteria bacterium]|nr:DsrE family protein [Gammaproteobacteria bacterium]MDH5652644.1 DsrE family protein [Gammaproteobacteria bacterium]